ncbi:hypothetical protein BD626DRAFT_482625 [Schizophyllum amplum]|uniref:Uncharacterized protein n=1 Tax=Schizophyllum amplum TaxID=97359 RepID=A0A550CVE4_9AGAR|nr:hypothetical protein BD626DRAFT_482625 [Auriculariopsis ampla]
MEARSSFRSQVTSPGRRGPRWDFCMYYTYAGCTRLLVPGIDAVWKPSDHAGPTGSTKLKPVHRCHPRYVDCAEEAE